MSDNERPSDNTASLDLVFTVLRKHEEALDKVARRLEDIADAISMVKEPAARPKVDVESISIERISDWKEFKERSSSAAKVLYEIGMGFIVRALMPTGRILKYSEHIFKTGLPLYSVGGGDNEDLQQKHTVKLECGLEFFLRRTESITKEGEYTQGILVSVDLNKINEWLADQLSVERSKIASGRVVI
jgi:hypothetical protein